MGSCLQFCPRSGWLSCFSVSADEAYKEGHGGMTKHVSKLQPHADAELLLPADCQVRMDVAMPDGRSICLSAQPKKTPIRTSKIYTSGIDHCPVITASVFTYRLGCVAEKVSMNMHGAACCLTIAPPPPRTPPAKSSRLKHGLSPPFCC